MSFTLESGTDTVTIHNATFGDTRQYDDARVINRNRAQEPLISRDDDWGEFYTYDWPFVELKETEKSELQTILADHAGELFVITDHEKVITGYIVSNEISFTEGFTDRWDCRIQMISLVAPDEENYLLLEDATNLLFEDDQKSLLEVV